MRILCLVFVLALLAAGCTQPATDSTTTTTTVTPAARKLPEDIHKSEMVPVGGDPFNFAMMPVCSQPVSGCVKVPFTLESNVTVEATLTWGVPANDFDLYVYEGSTDISEAQGASGVNSGSTTAEERVLLEDLPPGDYEVYVVEWLVAADTYTLDVRFT